eukprot:7495949-Lingulodinium_polyedra.AAC.1
MAQPRRGHWRHLRVRLRLHAVRHTVSSNVEAAGVVRLCTGHSRCVVESGACVASRELGKPPG